jgi:hypothetical protein
VNWSEEIRLHETFRTRFALLGSEGLQKWMATIRCAFHCSLLQRGIYGENHRVLYTQQLQEKGNQVDRAGATRETDSVRATTTEVGMTGQRPLASGALLARSRDPRRLIGSSLSEHMLALLGPALSQRLQSCIREFENSKVEVRSISCPLARCGYQSGGERLVPLESKTRHVTDDSF